jgi:hypothetical protein
MNATTTINPGTVQIKRSHLVGLVVGVVALSVALTTGAQAVLDSSTDQAGPTPSYAEAVAAMTPDELGAAFGNVPVYSAQAYIDSVSAMTPAELAATWGNVPAGNPGQDFIDAVSEMTPAARAATWGNTLVGP